MPPSRVTQIGLRALIDGAKLAASRDDCGPLAAIVLAYLAGARLEPEQVGRLVRQVRAALS